MRNLQIRLMIGQGDHLTNCFHRKFRPNLGIIDLTYCQLDLCSKKQKQTLKPHYNSSLSQIYLHSSAPESSTSHQAIQVGVESGWCIDISPAALSFHSSTLLNFKDSTNCSSFRSITYSSTGLPWAAVQSSAPAWRACSSNLGVPSSVSPFVFPPPLSAQHFGIFLALVVPRCPARVTTNLSTKTSYINLQQQ